MSSDVDLRTAPGNANARTVKRAAAPAPRGRAGLEAASGSFVERALQHLSESRDALGLEEGQTPEFAADPRVQQTSAGAVAVHARQEYKGIPIFEAGQAVRFDPTGELQGSIGTTVVVFDELDVNPVLDAAAAVAEAARFVATPRPADDPAETADAFGNPIARQDIDVKGFEPKVVARFPEIPAQPTVLAPGPFGDVLKASLVWFPLSDTLRLSWQVILTMPNLEAQFQVLVDADDGRVVLARQMVRFAAADGAVFERTFADGRVVVRFPRALSDYPVPAPADLPATWANSGSPDDWVDDGATSGYSVNAHMEDAGQPIPGARQNGVVEFRPADPEGADQQVVNAFYHACYLHDLFYLLGFRERDGNFQQDNFGRGGAGNDRVDVRVYERPVQYTASMTFPAEGASPVMKLGVVRSTGRHTAFDASVVFHEYMHGVTNRLVGGGIDVYALSAQQSVAMGEGWGDYIACTLLGTTVVGAWVTNKPRGIRTAPFDADYPGHFGLIGVPPYDNVHSVGEIWAAALLEGNRRMDRALGTGRGAPLGLQIVVDALKLSPANPTFLEMRDSILAALDAMSAARRISTDDHHLAHDALWAAFAHFGMGVNATAADASFEGVVADMTVPPSLAPAPAAHPAQPVVPATAGHGEAAPNVPIPDKDPVGITSAITLAPGSAPVTKVSVAVDIEHPFTGDLLVKLRSPRGTAVTLHENDRLPGKDLVRTYTTEDTPALKALIGEPAEGRWTLTVADLDRPDAGTLRRWSIATGAGAPQGRGPSAQPARGPATRPVGGEATPALAIPDKDPRGVTSSISIPAGGAARRITVAVDVTHPWAGDLQVALRAPNGARAVLREPTGLEEHDLHGRFTSDDTPSLTALLGTSVAGEWRLEVADLARLSTGTLAHWRIDFDVAS